MADQLDHAAQQSSMQNVLMQLRQRLHLSAAGRGAVKTLVSVGCPEAELLSWLSGLSDLKSWAKGKRPSVRKQYTKLAQDAKALAGQINAFIDTVEGGALVAEGAPWMATLPRQLLNFAERIESIGMGRSRKQASAFDGRESLVAYVLFRTRRPHDREVAKLLTEITGTRISPEALAVWRGKNSQRVNFVLRRLNRPRISSTAAGVINGTHSRPT
jgi:hypothetical protein